jgi:quercetin dioxygenase-like cupin family protein
VTPDTRPPVATGPEPVGDPAWTAFRAEAAASGHDAVLVREWAAGHDTGTHTHPFDVLAVVARGAFDLVCAGTVKRLAAGERFTLARDIPHGEVYGPEGATVWVARRGAAS